MILNSKSINNYPVISQVRNKICIYNELNTSKYRYFHSSATRSLPCYVRPKPGNGLTAKMRGGKEDENKFRRLPGNDLQ